MKSEPFGSSYVTVAASSRSGAALFTSFGINITIPTCPLLVGRSRVPPRSGRSATGKLCQTVPNKGRINK